MSRSRSTDSPQPAVRHRALPRRGRLAAVAAFVALAASGCSYDQVTRFGFPRAITPQAADILRLWRGSTFAALAVGLFVWGLIFFAVLRYKKRTDELPLQVRYNLPIEVLYTVVPLIIVLVLFFYTAVSENYIDELKPNPDVTVGVVGVQWNWQFNYIDGDGDDANDVQITGQTALGQPPVVPARLVLPVGKRIRFIETSPDVIHSFFVPAFLFKRDVVPGRQNQFEVTIDKPGRYVGRCAEFCGVNHAYMNFEVDAVSPQAFDSFLAEYAGRPGAVVPRPVAAGASWIHGSDIRPPSLSPSGRAQ